MESGAQSPPGAGPPSQAGALRGEASNLARVEAFSDGVIAIAITLLVLNITVPADVSDVAARLGELWPELFAYALSFAVIGRLWIVHRSFFETLVRGNEGLLWLNLLFLGFVALIPFTSEFVGTHSEEPLAVISYALVLSAAGIAHWLNVRHAVRCRLVHSSLHEQTAHFGSLVSLAWVAVFLASVPVALVSPTAAMLIWIGVLFVHPRRLARIRRDS